MCRDRGRAYAEATRVGAPRAEPVADRWHLWKHLCEAVDKTVAAYHGCIEAAYASAEPPPVGLLLTVAYAVADLVPLPAFVVVDLAYLVAVAVAVVVRRAGTVAGLLIAPAGLIFALAALTGAPAAREPATMVANAGALAAAAGVAFALTIPFMSTLPPALLGAALDRRRHRPRRARDCPAAAFAASASARNPSL